jgi:DNA-binding GntR family transcriptional regulator
MPVRDALQQLAYEGFLAVSDGRSVVAPLNKRDVLDIYVIEGLLHGLATRRVAERASNDDVAELRKRHKEMLEAEKDGDVERMASLNWHFHRRINQMANSPKLSAALRTLALSIPRDYVVEFPHWMHRANEEHGAILEVLATSDGDRAEALMRQHVEAAGRDLVDYLSAKGLGLE